MALGLGNRVGDIREYQLISPVLKVVKTSSDFNGTHDYYQDLNYAYPYPSADLNNGMSLVACVKCDTVSNEDTIIGWEKQLSLPVRRNGLFLGVKDSKFHGAAAYGESATWEDDSVGSVSGTISDNTWYHVALVASYNGSSLAVKLYVNGVGQTGSWDSSDFSEFTKTNNLTVGTADVAGGGPYWPGRINMIGLYTGSLLEADVEMLYNNGDPIAPVHRLNSPTCGSYWKDIALNETDEINEEAFMHQNDATSVSDYMKT